MDSVPTPPLTPEEAKDAISTVIIPMLKILTGHTFVFGVAVGVLGTKFVNNIIEIKEKHGANSDEMVQECTTKLTILVGLVYLYPKSMEISVNML
jgi:hypothetical protein